MLIVGFLSWWYGAGWRQRFQMVRERILATADYFSIDLLLSTLFAPFRQISAGSVSGPIGVRWRAFVDRLVSRFIGAVMRLFLILIGCASLVLIVIIGIIVLVLWAIVPLLPIIGVFLMLLGWVPTWM